MPLFQEVLAYHTSLTRVAGIGFFSMMYYINLCRSQSVFCPERRPGDKHGLPPTLSVMSETAEASAGVLDARVQAALAQYHAHLQYIHISDRYSGPKQMESVP